MNIVQDLINKCSSIWTVEEEKRVIRALKDWKIGLKKERKDYHLFQNYIVQEFAGIERIVTKKKKKVVATKITALSIIRDVHVAGLHKGVRTTHEKIRENYSNISRKIVEAYIRQCERCTEKLKKKENKGIVIRPITANDFNDRVQVDLVDFQSLPDGNFKFVLHYQDFLTKYHLLRPMPCKTALNVAKHVLQIFVDFGAPAILQSDNGREFTASVIKVCISIINNNLFS